MVKDLTRDFAAAFKQLKSALRNSRLKHWFDRRKRTEIPAGKLHEHYQALFKSRLKPEENTFQPRSTRPHGVLRRTGTMGYDQENYNGVASASVGVIDMNAHIRRPSALADGGPQNPQNEVVDGSPDPHDTDSRLNVSQVNGRVSEITMTPRQTGVVTRSQTRVAMEQTQSGVGVGHLNPHEARSTENTVSALLETSEELAPINLAELKIALKNAALIRHLARVVFQ